MSHLQIRAPAGLISAGAGFLGFWGLALRRAPVLSKCDKMSDIYIFTRQDAVSTLKRQDVAATISKF